MKKQKKKVKKIKIKVKNKFIQITVIIIINYYKFKKLLKYTSTVVTSSIIISILLNFKIKKLQTDLKLQISKLKKEKSDTLKTEKQKVFKEISMN